MALLTSGYNNSAQTDYHTSRVVPSDESVIFAAAVVFPYTATVTYVAGNGIGLPILTTSVPIPFGATASLYVFEGLCFSYIYDVVTFRCSDDATGLIWAIFEATDLQTIGPLRMKTLYQSMAGRGSWISSLTSTLPFAAADPMNSMVLVTASTSGPPTVAAPWQVLVDVDGGALGVWLSVRWANTTTTTVSATFPATEHHFGYVHSEIAAFKSDRIIKETTYYPTLGGTSTNQ